MERDTPFTTEQEIHDAIAGGLLHRALAMLNAQTNLRFTGIYRFEPPLLRSVALYDRENPRLELGGDTVRLDDAFCAIVGETTEPLRVPTGTGTLRMAGVSTRSGVHAYCGVPLRTLDGEPFGTLCHFDLRPRITGAADVALLERFAPALIRALGEMGWSAVVVEPTIGRPTPAPAAPITGRERAAPPDSAPG